MILLIGVLLVVEVVVDTVLGVVGGLDIVGGCGKDHDDFWS
jgi:hypothetical protein